MTRISTLSQNQYILQSTLATQSRLYDLRRQLASGNKAADFRDLASQAQSLSGALTRIARAEQYQANNVQTKAKLTLREAAVREISELAKDLKAQFIEAEGAEDSRQLQADAENQLTRLVSILNSRDQNGNYMFAGSRTNLAPVTMTANGAPPSAFTFTFNNDQVVEQARIDDGLVIDIGVLAGADAATPAAAFAQLFEVLNYFAAGVYPPPVAGTPAMPQPGVPPVAGAPAQVIPVINAALDAVDQLDAALGLRLKLLEQVEVGLQEDVDLTREFAGAINDADIAEVMTRISQDEVALEASYRITGELRLLSLVEFL
ncbi:MAG TPA: hypothetical protein VGB88_11990 [Alphaproteobacteria bacterium]